MSGIELTLGANARHPGSLEQGFKRKASSRRNVWQSPDKSLISFDAILHLDTA